MDDMGAASFDELSKLSGKHNAAYKISKSSFYRWSENNQVSVRSAKRIATAFSINWQWVHSGALPIQLDVISEDIKEPEALTPSEHTDNSSTALRLRLLKGVYKYFDWEIDLLNSTYTFQKRLIDTNAHINENITIPLDDLFNYIIEEDHNAVIESISDCIHDLDNNVYSINYRYKTAEGIQTRHSFAMAEFDDYTRAIKIIGISETASVNRPSKNANQMELLDD